MQFERDRLLAAIDGHRPATRGIVDALVQDDRQLWFVVARRGEAIDEWLHGTDFEEIAPLRVGRTTRGGSCIVLDDADPSRDRLLSETEDLG